MGDLDISHLSAHGGIEAVFRCLGVTITDKQSDEFDALRQPNEQSKARWMHGHAQRGLLSDLEELGISHLSALGGIEAV